LTLECKASDADRHGFCVKQLHRNVQRFRGGLVFKAHRLCVSLNSRLGSNKEEKKATDAAEPGRFSASRMTNSIRVCLSIRCILGDIRLWVGDTATSSRLV